MLQSRIIQSYLNYRPNWQWIVENSNLPYLKLDIDVPHQLIFKEWQTIADQAVLHRDNDYGLVGNQGWRSLTIYGVDSANTTDSIAEKMHWTSVADCCATTVQWLKQNFVIDSNTGRIRFMLLEPGGIIAPHTDRPNRRLAEINIAIHHPHDTVFRFRNYGNIPFESGQAFIVDTSNEHMVINNSSEPRLHIIVHGDLLDPTLIEQSYANSFYR